MFDVFIHHKHTHTHTHYTCVRKHRKIITVEISIDPASLESVGGWNAFSDIV